MFSMTLLQDRGDEIFVLNALSLLLSPETCQRLHRQAGENWLCGSQFSQASQASDTYPAAMRMTYEHEQIRGTVKCWIAEQINPQVNASEEAETSPARQVFKHLGDLGLLVLDTPTSQDEGTNTDGAINARY